MTSHCCLKYEISHFGQDLLKYSDAVEMKKDIIRSRPNENCETVHLHIAG